MTDLERAREIAEHVLFPAAPAVDSADRVPASHLDLLAADGFYGLAAPDGSPGGAQAETVFSGAGHPQRLPGGTQATAAEARELPRIAEILASGCLATTFVWMQHHSAVRGVAASEIPGVREQWLEPLRRGQRRAGVVQAALRPGAPALRARAVEGGYVLSGTAAWVTGWDMVDVLYTAVRVPEDTVRWLLVDAQAGPTLAAQPLRLVAVDASRTVELHFTDHFVPAARLVTSVPYEGGQPAAPAALRGNGSLALGLAYRCARLSGSAELAASVERIRAELDAAVDGPPRAMPEARAAASALAMRAATELAVGTGARSVLAGEHAQRLVREAMFLLVFGSRPAIREALLDRVRAWGP